MSSRNSALAFSRGLQPDRRNLKGDKLRQALEDLELEGNVMRPAALSSNSLPVGDLPAGEAESASAQDTTRAAPHPHQQSEIHDAVAQPNKEDASVLLRPAMAKDTVDLDPDLYISAGGQVASRTVPPPIPSRNPRRLPLPAMAKDKTDLDPDLYISAGGQVASRTVPPPIPPRNPRRLPPPAYPPPLTPRRRPKQEEANETASEISEGPKDITASTQVGELNASVSGPTALPALPVSPEVKVPEVKSAPVTPSKQQTAIIPSLALVIPRKVTEDVSPANTVSTSPEAWWKSSGEVNSPTFFAKDAAGKPTHLGPAALQQARKERGVLVEVEETAGLLTTTEPLAVDKPGAFPGGQEHQTGILIPSRIFPGCADLEDALKGEVNYEPVEPPSPAQIASPASAGASTTEGAAAGDDEFYGWQVFVAPRVQYGELQLEETKAPGHGKGKQDMKHKPSKKKQKGKNDFLNLYTKTEPVAPLALMTVSEYRKYAKKLAEDEEECSVKVASRASSSTKSLESSYSGPSNVIRSGISRVRSGLMTVLRRKSYATLSSASSTKIDQVPMPALSTVSLSSTLPPSDIGATERSPGRRDVEETRRPQQDATSPSSDKDSEVQVAKRSRTVSFSTDVTVAELPPTSTAGRQPPVLSLRTSTVSLRTSPASPRTPRGTIRGLSPPPKPGKGVDLESVLESPKELISAWSAQRASDTARRPSTGSPSTSQSITSGELSSPFLSTPSPRRSVYQSSAHRKPDPPKSPRSPRDPTKVLSDVIE